MRERWTLEREKDRKFQLPAMISRNLLHIFSHCGIKHRACTITRGILAKPRGAYRTFSHGWAFTPKFRKLAELMDRAETDVLAFMAFPKAHWVKLYSTNPIERLNAEVKRRTDVVGIFPNEAAILRLVGAILLEQTDEWAIQRCYMTLETIVTLSDDPDALPALAAA
jgi:transposase-like protein